MPLPYDPTLSSPSACHLCSARSILGSSPRNITVGSAGTHAVGSVPIPKFQHPSHALLEENGFKQMKYVKFYKRCMEDRTKHGHGHSEEMNTLFRWALGEGAGGRLRGRCWGSRHDKE